ncbi:DUF1735 domain-containing protein [Marivirga tractuosa]|uniref:DUF1735 domain-containing protein n=1 Tax=Marivirga tractuosa TaxID=1006 RepID=UPI0035D0CDD0
MKKILYIVYIAVLTPFLTGCFEEPGTAKLMDGQDDAFVELADVSLPGGLNKQFNVVLDGETTTGEIMVAFGGAVQTSDVTVDYEFDAENSTAIEGVDFTFTSTGSVTIPAGEYSAPIVFEVNDDILDPSLEPKTIAIRITNAPVEINQNYAEGTFNLVGLCPINADFTGDYLIEDVTGSPAGGGGSVFGNVVVEVESTGDASRVIKGVTYLPGAGIGQPAIDFEFELFCSQATALGEQESALACDAGILFGPAEEGGIFDPNDDSSFEITFIEDVNDDCGGGANPVTIRLVKQ